MTIKEVSAATGFSDHTLRYYEKEGILQGVKRGKSGHRDFSDDDVNVLNFLSCLKMADMSVKHLKEFTELLYQGDDTIPQRLELLKKQEGIVLERLEKTRAALEHIQWKIGYYCGVLKDKEEV